MMDSPSGVSCSAVVCANDISGPVKYDKFSLALKFLAANRPLPTLFPLLSIFEGLTMNLSSHVSSDGRRNHIRYLIPWVSCSIRSALTVLHFEPWGVWVCSLRAAADCSRCALGRDASFDVGVGVVQGREGCLVCLARHRLWTGRWQHVAKPHADGGAWRP